VFHTRIEKMPIFYQPFLKHPSPKLIYIALLNLSHNLKALYLFSSFAQSILHFHATTLTILHLTFCFVQKFPLHDNYKQLYVD